MTIRVRGDGTGDSKGKGVMVRVRGNRTGEGVTVWVQVLYGMGNSTVMFNAECLVCWYCWFAWMCVSGW